MHPCPISASSLLSAGLLEIIRTSQVNFLGDEKSAVLNLSIACLFIHASGWTAVERQHSCGESQHTAHVQFLDSNSASNKTRGRDHGGMQTELLLPLAPRSLAARARRDTPPASPKVWGRLWVTMPIFHIHRNNILYFSLVAGGNIPTGWHNFHSCRGIFTHRDRENYITIPLKPETKQLSPYKKGRLYNTERVKLNRIYLFPSPWVSNKGTIKSTINNLWMP